MDGRRFWRGFGWGVVATLAMLVATLVLHLVYGATYGWLMGRQEPGATPSTVAPGGIAA